MVARIYPQDARYVTDYAACLPLAECLGRSAEFAVDHEGDHGPQAMREWLDVIGLEWSEPTDDTLTAWTIQRHAAVRVSVPVVWTVPEGIDAWDARYRTTGGHGTRYGTQRDRRIARIREDLTRRIARMVPGTYGPDIENMHHNGRTITADYVLTASTSRGETVRAADQDAALAMPAAEPFFTERHAAWLRLNPGTLGNLLREALSVDVPRGWTVRVGHAVITRSESMNAWEESRDDDDVIDAIAEAYGHGGTAAVATGFGITTTEAIATDEWLSMIRDTAVEYEWCSEHHALITRVTHATREPFGYSYGGEFTATITADNEGIVTSWHGREEQDAPDAYQVESIIRSALRDHGYEISVDVDGSMSQDEYEPAAHRNAAWVVTA